MEVGYLYQMSITNAFCRRTKNIIIKLLKKSFVKVDMRQVAACDLLEAVEGDYQDLRLFQDLNPVLCGMYSQSIPFTSKLVIQFNEYLLFKKIYLSISERKRER